MGRVLVPTMGALHHGHRALIQEGSKWGKVTVSIFVNPTQFAPHEDFDTYPRDNEKDEMLARLWGATGVWFPSSEEIYPHGPKVTECAGVLGGILEGEHRPGFFDGVLTVVSRLFDLFQPDIALFGEKDWQQLQVVKRFAKERGRPQILSVPTVRDADGLAASTRNLYLTGGERERAHLFPQAFQVVRALWEKGERDRLTLEGAGLEVMGGISKQLDYWEMWTDDLSKKPTLFEGKAVLLGALRVGGGQDDR